MTKNFVIERFDPACATDAVFAAYHRVVTAGHRADRPDEPALPLDEVTGRLKNPLPGFGSAKRWVAIRDEQMVGIAEVSFLDKENSDIALTDISVHPDHRREGIGTALLRAALPAMNGRRVIEGWQVVEGSAGQQWAEVLGFRRVRTIVRQALTLAKTDSSRWDVDVPEGYRLLRWIGDTPDDVVDSYAKARGAIHDAPLGESEYRWPEWTVDRVREAEAEWRSQGIEQRVVVAVHEGTVAGLTEVAIHPRRPDWGYQRDTAVLPAHRGHGLGRCIKAHMMRWLTAERPGLEWVSTTTGADNAHMIRVNEEIGFTTLRSMIAVQKELSRG